jgi:hypothetical protein
MEESQSVPPPGWDPDEWIAFERAIANALGPERLPSTTMLRALQHDGYAPTRPITTRAELDAYTAELRARDGGVR